MTVRKPSIMEDYFGAGYGMPTKAGSTVCRLVKKKEGIALDHTYTAKTFAAVTDYCSKPGRDPGPVLYWHTHNSVDLSGQADSVNHRDLPKALQVFIKEVSVMPEV